MKPKSLSIGPAATQINTWRWPNKNDYNRTNHLPPSMPAHAHTGHTLPLAADPLGYLEKCVANCGDIAYLKVRGMPVYVISGGEYLETALSKHNLRMDALSRGLEDALGLSLLVSDGQVWRDRRRVVLPAFSNKKTKDFVQLVQCHAVEEFQGWPANGLVNLSHSYSLLASRTTMEATLGTEIPVDQISNMRTYLAHLMVHARGIKGTGVRVPIRIPTPGNIRARISKRNLREIVSHSATYNTLDHDTVLDLLHAAKGKEEAGLDQQAVEDELLTMLLIGHETVALALSYVSWLLGIHTEVQEELRQTLEEVDQCGGLEAVLREPLLEAVIRESLRLYPPVWATGRETIEPLQIGEYTVPTGSQILYPIWANHHRPDWYAYPHEFRPTRWLDEATSGLQKGAFMPFGLGIRRCLGEQQALMQLKIVVYELLRHYRLESYRETITLQPSVTLRTKVPLNTLVHRL